MTADKPLKAVFLQLVNRCNARCVSCPYESTHALQPGQRMLSGLYNKILDDLTPSYSGQIGLYLQHEPLVEDRLSLCITLAKHKCPQSSIVIATNGSLMTEERTHELINTPLDVVYFNISAGTKETYEKLMTPLKWEQTITNVKYFIKKFKGKVIINFVKTEANVKEVPVLKTLFPEVNVHALYWATSRLGSVDIPRIGVSKFKVCDFVNLPILCDGTILLCCNCWKREVVVGNAYTDNILEIWQDELMQPNHAVCKQCW